MKNKKRFAENMAGMGEAFGTEITELRGKIYWRVLERFSDDQVENAMFAAISTLKWFPRPAELVELIEGKGEDRATEAWGILLDTIRSQGAYQSVIFRDGRIARSVEMMGGWQQVCTMTESETHWRQKDFVSAYKGLTGQFHPTRLAGIHELQNVLHGYVESIPEAVFIGNGSEIKQLEAP